MDVRRLEAAVGNSEVDRGWISSQQMVVSATAAQISASGAGVSAADAHGAESKDRTGRSPPLLVGELMGFLGGFDVQQQV